MKDVDGNAWKFEKAVVLYIKNEVRKEQYDSVSQIFQCLHSATRYRQYDSCPCYGECSLKLYVYILDPLDITIWE